MFLSNSRDIQTGFFALQSPNFSQRGFSLSFREMIGAARVDDRLTWERDEDFGRLVYDRDSVGDIHGGQLWEIGSGSEDHPPREIPMWRFATPVVMSQPPEEVDEPDCDNRNHRLTFSPWKEAADDYPYPLPDERLEGFDVKIPSADPAGGGDPIWPHIPAGVVGISLTTNEEEAQQNLFLPTDPRLIANTAGDPSANTLVCDCEGFEISTPLNGRPGGTIRIANLNTGFKVIPSPLAGNCGLRGPFLALQADADPCLDTSAGAISFQNARGRNYTAGMFGWGGRQTWNPPFHPGHDTDDMHKIAVDPDGNRINVLHMWIDANWYANKKKDGPLDFRKDDFPQTKRGDTAWEVDLLFDTGTEQEDHCGEKKFGKWRWVAWSNEDSSTSGGDTGIQPGPPLNGGGHSHGDEFGVGGRDRLEPPGQGGGAGLDDDRHWPMIGDDDAGRREHLIAYVEKGFPGLLARPQFFASGRPDFRTKIIGKSKQQVDQLRRETPLTARLESIGQQSASEWSYAKDPGSLLGRYPSGSASGGFVLTSSDVGVEDHVLGTYDSTDDNAEASLVIAPDSSFVKFGTPDPTNEAMISSGFGIDYASVSSTMRVRRWSGSAWSSHLSLDSTGTTADDTLRCSKALVLEDGGVLQIMSGEVTVTASYHSLK